MSPFLNILLQENKSAKNSCIDAKAMQCATYQSVQADRVNSGRTLTGLVQEILKIL